MNNIQIKIQKFFPDVKLPEKKTPGAAAMDIAAYCPKANIIIEVWQTVLIPTGFCLEIPEGYFVEIRPRSGLSSKENILIPNSPGTVDSDYRGQVFVPLLNLSKAPFTVTNGLRIAQTVYGKIGIKVWICKGEIYGKRDLSPNVGQKTNEMQRPKSGTGGGGDRDRERGGGRRSGGGGGRGKDRERPEKS